MRILDELEREIERIAYAAKPARSRRRWRRSGALLGLLPLGIATVAVAATTGILFGEPVKNHPHARLDPKAGVGVNAGPGTLFDIRAADPGGGPAWGVRLVKTSRGLGCVRAGRVVEGRLGVLGRDGAFSNDGKFHEIGAEVLETSAGCQQADGAGNIFVAVSHVGLPASGDATGCRPRTDCPPGSLRDVHYGLLGPEAAAITYRDGGRLVRQEVSGPEGAYLVVRATDPKRRNVGWWSPSLSPGWVQSIEFRDGTVCRPKQQRRVNGLRRCPLKGYVQPQIAPATRAQLKTPIHVRVGTKRERPAFPGMSRKVIARTPWQRRITVRFRARLAADAKSFYMIRSEHKGGGEGCNSNLAGPIARDIKAGAVITETLWVGYRCRGTITIRIGYEQQRGPTMDPFFPNGWPNAKVGKAVVRLR